VFILTITNNLVAQSNWESPKYGYQIEVPSGFERIDAVGLNVDYKSLN